MKFHNLLFAVVSAGCSEPLLGNNKTTCNGKNTSDYSVDYGVNGSTITICIRNQKDDGWIALGPGTRMEGTVVGSWGQGQFNAFDLNRTDEDGITADNSTELDHTNVVVEEEGGKRVLCFDILKAKIEGTEAAAKFIWARGGDTLEAGSANKHNRAGKFVLDLTDLEVSVEENDTTTTVTANVTANVTTNSTDTEGKEEEEEEESLLDKTEVRIAGVFVVLLAAGGGYFIYERKQKESQAREAAAEAERAAERARESKRGKKKKSRRSRRSG